MKGQSWGEEEGNGEIAGLGEDEIEKGRNERWEGEKRISFDELFLTRQN